MSKMVICMVRASLCNWLVVTCFFQIEMGSTNVRIGSTIFGPREYPKKEPNLWS